MRWKWFSIWMPPVRIHTFFLRRNLTYSGKLSHFLLSNPGAILYKLTVKFLYKLFSLNITLHGIKFTCIYNKFKRIHGQPPFIYCLMLNDHAIASWGIIWRKYRMTCLILMMYLVMIYMLGNSLQFKLNKVLSVSG